MYMTNELRASILKQLREGRSIQGIAGNHAISVSTVKYIARAFGVYQKPSFKRMNKKEEEIIAKYIEANVSPAVKRQIESNLSHKMDSTRKVTTGIAKLVIQLVTGMGMHQTTTARALGLDQSTVGSIVRGEHGICAKLGAPKKKAALKSKPTPVQIAPQPVVTPATPVVQHQPGILRRVWRYIFA